MTDDKIDFSALDPKRDPERFERMVQHVVHGARAAATTSTPPLFEFLRWGRLGLAAAALLALAVWLPKLGTESHSGESAVAVVSSWARSGEVPTNVDVIQTLGELDAR